MKKNKSEDYKISAVKYYLNNNKNQIQTCKIFGCHSRSLIRWVTKYKKNILKLILQEDILVILLGIITLH